MLTKKEIEFINNYREEDTNKLLLSNKDKELNISLCIKCIEARKKIEKKIPLWYSYPELCYPISLSIEQSSSQQTAQYKQKVIKDIFPNNPINIADITGGMGIDSYFLSKIANNLTYIERNTELCKAAQYNFSILGANNISIINTETLPTNNSLFDELSKRDISLIYADPARRDNKNSKIVSIKDYEPNILELLSNLFSIANYILIKISPMEDIKLNLSLLPNTTNIYVISYNNVCKEVLFLFNKIHTNV